jgi:hypothetical protein
MSLLKSFNCRKRDMGYVKVIHKRKKKVLEKIDKFPRYLKQWVLRCPSKKEKKEEKK